MNVADLLNKIKGDVSSTEAECFTDDKCRVLLVARARWLLLLFLGAFSIFAAALFSFSSYGFFLEARQIVAIILIAGAIIGFNLLASFSTAEITNCHRFKYLNILFDLAVVTLLIHYSGGAASWFWPVYLLVTLEAALLFENTWEVWLLGAVGGALYGGLLWVENADWIPNLLMPFVDDRLHHDPLYLLLIWLWVSILNATISIIGAFLMNIIRQENRAAITSREQLTDFLQTAHDLIFSAKGDGTLIYTNRSWQRALGFDPKDGSSLNLFDLFDSAHRSRINAAFQRVLAGSAGADIEGELIGAKNQHVAVEGSLTANREGVVWGICRDVTERKAAEAQLFHMAHHDTLTGLPNRLYFHDRLTQALSMAKRLNHEVAVLFLDLDRFKIINDTLGHGVGDRLLQVTAERLQECIRESDTVGRHGGDEFTVLLVNLTSRNDAEVVAKKILKALARPVVVDTHELFITTSIGICMFPDDATDATGMIKKADVAMYAAKTSGKNNIKFYHTSMDLDSDKRLKLETSLRRAIDNQEFVIHYQPKVDLTSNQVTAVEALLRWNHPDLGLLPPSEFISLAEETGLIFTIGEWVMEESCRQNVTWQRAGLPKVRVAVNLSGYQLQQSSLIDTVTEVLTRTGMSPEFLEFEVTETVIMQNPDFAVKILAELRDLGVHISIDDFGTGYSSLAHLKRFSINTLKIDKSFVRDVEINSTDAAIATAIISMGNSLNLKVIAEGVETEGQLQFLKDKACDEIQGYIFSKPLPAEEISTMLMGIDPARVGKVKD